ncbi:ABC transporter permease [Chryseolinea sp. T2]|uniref:ABC transporter permease n=1 Tax=Chryseolinea sp. T2 TaxID=3129255 RepID=UPI0030773B55
MGNKPTINQSWDTILVSKTPLLNFPVREVWRYRDLLMMFVKRDVVTLYKQTILGPVWFFIQPILTTIVYIVIFGGIAGISTDGVPRVLFYSAGIVLWNYFSEVFSTTSRTFKESAGLFGKVYFPRIIVPVSKVLSGLLKFFVQMLFFLCVFFFFSFKDSTITPNSYIWLVPLLVLLMAGLSLALGIIFTSLTSKYRDLTFLIQFGVQLLMYATPVIYPMSAIPEKYRIYIELNPITPIVEAFRHAFLGTGEWSWIGLGYSLIVSLVLGFIGVVLFNRVERTFMDTV